MSRAAAAWRAVVVAVRVVWVVTVWCTVGSWAIVKAPWVWYFDVDGSPAAAVARGVTEHAHLEIIAVDHHDRRERHRRLWWVYAAGVVAPAAAVVWAMATYVAWLLAWWQVWVPAAWAVVACLVGRRQAPADEGAARPGRPGVIGKAIGVGSCPDVSAAIGKVLPVVAAELREDPDAVRYVKIRAVKTRVGTRVEPILPGGATVADLRKAGPRLAALMGVDAAQMIITKGGSEAHAVIDILDEPMRARPPRPWAYAGAPSVDVWAPITVGHDALDEPITLPFAGVHWMLGGQSGSGKSTFMRSACATAVLDPLTELHIADLGGAVDFADLRQLCASYSLGHGPEQMDHLDKVLTYLEEQIEVRSRLMDEHEEDFSEAKVTRAAALKHGLTWICVVIDECHLAMNDKARRDRITEIATVGRKFAVSFRFATPYPTDAVFPAALAQVCAGRVAFAVEAPAASNVILGPGMVGEGYDASDLTMADAGIAWVKGTGTPVLTKTPHVARAEVQGLVAQVTATRKPREITAAPAAPATLRDELLEVWATGRRDEPATAMHLTELADALGTTAADLKQRAFAESIPVVSVNRRRPDPDTGERVPTWEPGIRVKDLDHPAATRAA